MQTLIQAGVTVEGATRTDPIVVATDGLPQSRGALAMARALAGTLHGTINVVAVHQSIGMTAPDGQLLLDPNVAASLRADLTRRVREQCTGGGDDGALVEQSEVLNGEPARVISDVAAKRHAQLIIVGMGRHELVDRIFGDETALKVARTSHVPVLAVPDGDFSVPRHAVVAIDFSEGSVRAARAALRLLTADGVLELVHVVPRDRLFDAWVAQEEYVRFVRHSLTRFRARLAIPPNVRVDDVILNGDPARELLAYATRVGADLIAAGSHGHGFVTRLVIGSVTTKLLRMASCPVLVIPPNGQDDDRRGAATSATLTLQSSRWAEVLDDFTRRNGGRRTRLEVDDPELGAQMQEGEYPLLGVTFDPVDQHIEIMLGQLGAGEPHLSRSIASVDSLDVLTDRDDQDIALRLRHGEGQTILTLIR
jgi:nucleotide-binding universal stress UspA family protein